MKDNLLTGKGAMAFTAKFTAFMAFGYVLSGKRFKVAIDENACPQQSAIKSPVV